MEGSHTEKYLGKVGFMLNAPRMKRFIMGCADSSFGSGSRVATAERAVFSALMLASLS